ncbi:MobQ family relaxase [Fictibacillus terranigra]|uniref:MobQ family relaxase n=1 Tax=Fictibacillus terranigra TaxID=3058424 RepID=A0ABT8EC20_9BACL|nr:MobQ family relaxase [Fictibacillus sp. CENA-BCM004]MDN4075480.1 MobQ family relaxase [Fictibacillus sp. CENA-BCM004]
MAIYHFSNQIKSRKKQQSAIAAAAYRSGERLVDERTNEGKYYNRSVQPITHILAPSHAPQWVYQRERLWNEVERVEKQWNSQLCREINVALPKELSHEEQEKLAITFCQEIFADDGMVADVAIHRDDEENPHFHVLLTMRPFNPDGTWGNKQKKTKEVINGKVTTMAVHTTDWNTKEKLLYWREQWAHYANRFLEKNGFSARLSHLSHEARGLETLPTIHEGFAARKMESEGTVSDRMQINKERREYNRTVIELNEAKREKQKRERAHSFVRRFTPLEKKQLKEAAKGLRIFVNYENVMKRKTQLQKWQSRLNFQADSVEKQKKIDRIQNETLMLERAENILEKEASRFLTAYYPTLEQGHYSKEQKIAIVDVSLTENKKLNHEQIESLLKNVEHREVENAIDQLLNHRPAFVSSLHNEVKVFQQQFETLRIKNNIDFAQPNSIKHAPKFVLDKLQLLLQKKDRSAQALDLMNRLYDNRLEDLYPQWKGRLHLTLEQKEWLVRAQEYYEKEITPTDLPQSPRRYTVIEQEDLLSRLYEIKKVAYPERKRLYEQLVERYPQFQPENDSYLMMFYQECQQTIAELSGNAQRQLGELVKPRDLTNDVNPMNQMYTPYPSPQYDRSRTSDFFQILESAIREANKKWKEDDFERRQLKKKKNRSMER